MGNNQSNGDNFQIEDHDARNGPTMNGIDYHPRFSSPTDQRSISPPPTDRPSSTPPAPTGVLEIVDPKNFTRDTSKHESGLCANCSKPNATLMCGRCQTVFYCSQTCQFTHFKQHKKACRASSSHSPKTSPGGTPGPRKPASICVSRFHFLWDLSTGMATNR